MIGKRSKAIPEKGGSVLGSITIAWETQFKEGNVMWKVPRLIRLNDNIVVREDETAVFYRDGKVLTYFDQPNRYALTDFNAPVVQGLLKFFTGVQQQAEVYYIQRRFLDGKFGSPEPYQFTDPTFGVVSLKVYGEYRWRIANPENFINQFVGTFNLETSDQVEGRMRDQMVILVYNALGMMKDKGLKVTDIPANLLNIEQVVLANAPAQFQQYGVEINKISGLNISLPDDVQQAVDKRSEMSVLGVNYLQLQAGQAMVDAAKNPTGVAGAGAGIGIGLGAGAGMGYAMGGQMMGNMGAGFQQQSRSCPKCGSIIPANASFCPNCGAQLQAQQSASMIKCPKCGTESPAGTKFCPNCGTSLVQQMVKCASCGHESPAGTKFCPNCGKPL
ncbi:MAG: SPFH domain-containing protein [Candidatus Thermoplasmatota archaeon]|nr:SPFH domain-containing protein [Candidatus Thermoplasmatota archaeon]MCL5665305.1 SPFH domain-containing protein [Candidatus Thermoplasmatota archaeon]